MSRQQNTAKRNTAASDAVRDVQMQVMWNRLIALVEEQGQTLMRTAFSPIVRECGDLSAGVFDLRGRMLAQAVTGTPGHVNSMENSVGHFMRHFPIADMAEGDIYVTNNPWMGTGHLNDFVLTTPCFRRGKLVALLCCTSHLTDVGGLGTGPDGTDMHMEGLHVPMLKLADRGVFNTTLMSVLRANTRQPVESEGDIYSLAASNEVGCRRLVEMMDEFDLTDLKALGDRICGDSQRAVEEEVARLPDGVYRYSMTTDGYEEPVELVGELHIQGKQVRLNYSGTSRRSRLGINVPMAYTAAYSCFALKCAIAPEVPNNSGALTPFDVVAPEGCILNATYPAPVCIRHVIGQMLPDVVFGCLAQAIGERVPAEGASCLWNITFRGHLERGANTSEAPQFAITAVANGGTGARPGLDGLSGTAFPSGVRGTPVEINESVAPLLFHRKEYAVDSGGAGQFRGGLGQQIEIESAIDEDIELLAAFDRILHPARGRDSGHIGQAGGLWLEDGHELQGKGTQHIPAGQRLMLRTPGGGGLGEPAKRDRQLVEQDLKRGLISQRQAREVYSLNDLDANS